jgi:2-C-methyl-D-erythritol 4-phosphate cytidylyltransferase
LSQYPIYAVVPAAGIGKRMGSEIPKQYLTIDEQCIIEYALAPLLAHAKIDKVIVALSPDDQWFNTLSVANHPKIMIVSGGSERADSVLNALQVLPENGFVMVHDGARPCLTLLDINQLIDNVTHTQGAILGSLVRDTMKRVSEAGIIEQTVSRERLYHALTPQIFSTVQLKNVLKKAIKNGVNVTDEASAMEWYGMNIKMIEGRSDNIKVTRPEDLQLAQLFIQEQQRNASDNKK